MRMHKLFLTTVVATLSTCAHVMHERPKKLCGFFLHNATDKPVTFCKDTNQYVVTTITIAPSDTLFMPPSTSVITEIGPGWGCYLTFKQINPNEFLYCEWTGIVPVTARIPTLQELAAIQLLQTNATDQQINQSLLPEGLARLLTIITPKDQ